MALADEGEDELGKSVADRPAGPFVTASFDEGPTRQSHPALPTRVLVHRAVVDQEAVIADTGKPTSVPFFIGSASDLRLGARVGSSFKSIMCRTR